MCVELVLEERKAEACGGGGGAESLDKFAAREIVGHGRLRCSVEIVALGDAKKKHFTQITGGMEAHLILAGGV